jgi:hypothetical protein
MSMRCSNVLPGALAVLTLLGSPGVARAQSFDLPDIPRCTELTPGAVSVTNVPVTINVRVILDGIPQAAAAGAAAVAQAAYSRLNIGLSLSYERASFGNSEGAALIDEAKAFYGGAAPGGVHAVYVITAKDLYSEVAPGRQDRGLVGLADCIGGIVYPQNAFAVGEALADDPIAVGGVDLTGVNLAAKIFGHELGHLLGGHHHYANCVEAAADLDGGPCTLMINFVDLAGLRFAALNGVVVRGHAQLLPALPPASSVGDGGGGALAWPALLLLGFASILRRRELL